MVHVNLQNEEMRGDLLTRPAKQGWWQIQKTISTDTAAFQSYCNTQK